MPRFPIDRSRISGNKALITGQDHRHIVKVLRLAPGDDITLFDSESYEYYGKISSVSKTELEVEITQKTKVNRESNFNIQLFQAIPKGEKMDYIVEKATELGVTSITPVITQRVQFKLKDRQKRWEKIALEASKQCGRTVPTVIGDTLEFKNALLSCNNSSIKVILHVNTELSMKSYLKSTLQTPQNIILFIGPEGGFAEKEVLLAKEMGFTPLGLGPRVLRTETISVSVLSILQFLFGDF